ncbi:NADH-quinone oxidoreductase subunit L [Fundidesulfovibrio soli]|uniref:NADH-quinone oxidoreductase subunit L n=1 Tax=Fundidesulfovibrio soli TaxID=2922716 RepID=UPI001FAFFB49|nr:NADH-quinone oxidoreductase subunit L [Fundidesulfovibrio soli]
MKTLLVTMLLFPAAGALFQALPGRMLSRRLAGWAACAAVGGALAAAVAALSLTLGQGQTWAVNLCGWFAGEGFQAQASLLYDPLAGFMAVTVTFVSLLIHLYSTAFMREEQGHARYFCYLNLFVFFMLVITLADDLLFLFLGWEGVGFCSYALIGFWHQDTANVTAGGKAFILTRLGDLGLVAALALMAGMWGGASVSRVASEAASLAPQTSMILGFLILLAAVGKSAQLPLTVWLPDAMAGPTPVSALIHAATMVTAGAYLLMRLTPLLAHAPVVLEATALLGAFTALYGALAALAQRDIKRILAYSTISQVGYMFLAAGCGDVPGTMFHLMAHAFFKSLLFMAAGCLIRAVGGEHDIFRMGARLRREMPGVFVLFLCGAVSLAAMPLTAGYFSKGRVLADALSLPGWPYVLSAVLGLEAAFVTALYAFRLVYTALAGSPDDPAPHTPDTGMRRMELPLWPLAALALVFGFVNPPEVFGLKAWLDAALAGGLGHPAHAAPPIRVEMFVAALDAALALAGLWLARRMYGPGRKPASDAAWMSATGFGLDALYATLVAGPYRKLADFTAVRVDGAVLDRGVGGGAKAVLALSRAVSSLATGRVSTTLRALLASMAVALVYLALRLA